MTPELAAERAADILDKAETSTPEEGAKLVMVAAAWTRLHEVLTAPMRAVLDTTEQPITVNIKDAVIKDANPEQIAADVRRAMGIPDPNPEPGQVEPEPELWNPYRERAALVAHLAALYPAALVHDADPENPGWPVIYILAPHGQMSWHLAAEDLDLFAHIPERQGDQAPKWDGHTTAEKYERLALLTEEQSKYYKDPI